MKRGERLLLDELALGGPITNFGLTYDEGAVDPPEPEDGDPVVEPAPPPAHEASGTASRNAAPKPH